MEDKKESKIEENKNIIKNDTNETNTKEKTTKKKTKTKKNISNKENKEKDSENNNKIPKQKEGGGTKKYINAILAKAEKELFKSNPDSKTEKPLPAQKKRVRIKPKPILDNNKICHYFLKKGIDININEYDCFPIQKIKKQGNILSKFNLGINLKIGGINKINNLFKSKKKNVKYTDYYLFIDEYFIYFCKDVIIFTSDIEKRRIGSVVSFFNINNISSEKEEENNLFKIKLDLKFRNEINNKSKEFFIEMENYSDLIALFKEKIKEYDIKCNIQAK